jgi:hypothetical protein
MADWASSVCGLIVLALGAAGVYGLMIHKLGLLKAFNLMSSGVWPKKF